jgi:hypothetical protein
MSMRFATTTTRKRAQKCDIWYFAGLVNGSTYALPITVSTTDLDDDDPLKEHREALADRLQHAYTVYMQSAHVIKIWPIVATFVTGVLGVIETYSGTIKTVTGHDVTERISICIAILGLATTVVCSICGICNKGAEDSLRNCAAEALMEPNFIKTKGVTTKQSLLARLGVPTPDAIDDGYSEGIAHDALAAKVTNSVGDMLAKLTGGNKHSFASVTDLDLESVKAIVMNTAREAVKEQGDKVQAAVEGRIGSARQTVARVVDYAEAAVTSATDEAEAAIVGIPGSISAEEKV